MKAISAMTATILLGCAGCSSGVYIGSPTGAVSVPISAPSAAPLALNASVTLTSNQVALVRAHFSQNQGNGNGRGRGRNGGLPPGIARNLERGKALPPGIAKQYLPAELQARLPRLDSGLEYIVAAGKLLLVEAATQVVRDVLIDVIYG
jgi:hypothetical protein